jgi:hypothetical protein
MLGNHTEENIQHTEHGESLKSKIVSFTDYQGKFGVQPFEYMA